MIDLRYYPLNRDKIIWRDYTLDFGLRTYIMGILNITPDSFSDGGEFNSVESSLKQALAMVDEGADIIDIGGESTRPGGAPVSESVEIERVIPIIKTLKERVNLPLSLDTSKAAVGLKGLEAGVDMINDVWGFQREPELAEITSSFKVPAVLMHNQTGTDYSSDIISDIKKFFDKSISIAVNAGMDEKLIILDPGIGFGKTQENNREVLSRLGELCNMGFPVLLGTSRKSIVGTILNLPPKERLEGTLATSTMGIISGADILRVHDVKENKRVALVTDKIVRRDNG